MSWSHPNFGPDTIPTGPMSANSGPTTHWPSIDQMCTDSNKSRSTPQRDPLRPWRLGRTGFWCTFRASFVRSSGTLASAKATTRRFLPIGLPAKSLYAQMVCPEVSRIAPMFSTRPSLTRNRPNVGRPQQVSIRICCGIDQSWRGLGPSWSRSSQPQPISLGIGRYWPGVD